ncbi:choline-sulfatase [Phenylobacterium montanum]|uniref:Choline-sulfatase n=1 Tax=Phenylobacterium montanum TaxID=2823693 RepID=A0A975G0M1_9CAUL|nr:choline-sulfatase [Caulobacter sp. S6]QUD88302.1 choline-sulfatase [Caulobacter sp. S6]
MPSKKPNILVLMVDQMTPGVLAAYGGKVARTPHIDRLAERAVVFDSAYCNSPLCAPSRFSFMSGQLPSAIGAYDNAAEFAAETPTFAHYLRLAGYRTILSGKMHFCGPDQLHGFEERLTTDIYPADFGWTADWTRPGERLDFYHTMDSVTQAGPCARSNQLDFDEEVIFTARRRLFDLARAPDGRPFCMVVSMTHPHDPYTIPEPWWGRHSDDEIDMPRVGEGDVPLDPHSERLRTVIGLSQQSVSEAQVRAARRAYYGACAYVDDQIGAMLGALEACGMAEDTVVMLLGDHGDMLGERGLWYKMSFFEPACRIPLMVSAPRMFGARRVGGSVSLLDLLPTLAEIGADGAAPDYAAPIAGRSLLPHLSGGAGHDEVVGEYLGEGAIAPIVMLRRGPLKFIHCPVDPDQLYDLSRDPNERVNLATAPERADAVAAFRGEIARRWNLDLVNRQVLASQARRRLVDAAGQVGRRPQWDHQPLVDAGQSYMRNHMLLDDLEAMARFPRVI